METHTPPIAPSDGASQTTPIPQSSCPDAHRMWEKFGFQWLSSPIGTLPFKDTTEWQPPTFLEGILPAGLVAFVAESGADNTVLVQHVKHFGPPKLNFAIEGRQAYMYRLRSGHKVRARRELPSGVLAFAPGETLMLPAGPDFRWKPNWAASADDLTEIGQTGSLVEREIPNSVKTPLEVFSLRGRASEFEDLAVKAETLLGQVCLSGQATVWYAPPNAGKTLLALKLLSEAIEENRLAPDNTYYINADDGSEGFATKMRLMDDIGVHTLSPGQCGFRVAHLGEKLRAMAEAGSCGGVFIIVDTLKKFTDLMNKGQASEFADICRQFVMAGGTILGLAHTNKHRSSEGKLIHAGTADILQDFDAAYLLTPVTGEGGARIVEFEALKRRGGGIASVGYAYDPQEGITYEERFASVRLVDADYLNRAHLAEAEREASEVIAIVKDRIITGFVKKMELVKAVAKIAKVSERAALRVIETYTGENPECHHWRYDVRDRGAKIYSLLNKQGAGASAP